MAQAILIMAHRDFDHLLDIIDWFDDNFEFYIHIDKKFKPDQEVLNQIQSRKTVRYLTTQYSANWGGREYLKASLHLIEKALANPAITYVHTISGQDFPVRQSSYFKELELTSRDYMTHFKMPLQQWEGGGFERVEYYQFYDVFSVKTHRQWINRLLRLQKFFGFKRPYSSKLPILYGGDAWWSLSRNTMTYVLTYMKEQPAFFKRLKHSKLADEFFFQTVIMNSPHANNVVNDHLRYIDWSSGRGDTPANPANLDETDFNKIAAGKYLFARKFKFPDSNALKALLLQTIK